MSATKWFWWAPRHLLVLFSGTMLMLATTFGWLMWRLLEQGYQLETQHTQERLDSAADFTASALGNE